MSVVISFPGKRFHVHRSVLTVLLIKQPKPIPQTQTQSKLLYGATLNQIPTYGEGFYISSYI